MYRGVRGTGLYTVVLSQGCCQCIKITRSLHHTFYTGTNQSCTGISPVHLCTPFSCNANHTPLPSPSVSLWPKQRHAFFDGLATQPQGDRPLLTFGHCCAITTQTKTTTHGCISTSFNHPKWFTKRQVFGEFCTKHGPTNAQQHVLCHHNHQPQGQRTMQHVL